MRDDRHWLNNLPGLDPVLVRGAAFGHEASFTAQTVLTFWVTPKEAHVIRMRGVLPCCRPDAHEHVTDVIPYCP